MKTTSFRWWGGREKWIISITISKIETITDDHLLKILDTISTDTSHLPNVKICVTMFIVEYTEILLYVNL